MVCKFYLTTNNKVIQWLDLSITTKIISCKVDKELYNTWMFLTIPEHYSKYDTHTLSAP